jgi:esterase/lipase
MPSQEQEFKSFNIPSWLRKYFYGGFLTFLIASLIYVFFLFIKCQNTRADDKDKMYQEMKGIFQESLQKVADQKISPSIENMQEKVDSTLKKVKKIK